MFIGMPNFLITQKPLMDPAIWVKKLNNLSTLYILGGRDFTPKVVYFLIPSFPHLHLNGNGQLYCG
jgi:hypothetical protein